MCNAWNHSPGCDCGWGGNGGGYRGVSSGGYRTSYTFTNLNSNSSVLDNLPKVRNEDSRTFLTKCWWCGELVFYHTNGYGDCVLFDSLGYPWEIHECWENYWENEKYNRKEFNRFNAQPSMFYLNSDDQKLLILAGIIQILKSKDIIVSEKNVAKKMRLSLAKFRNVFQNLYTLHIEYGQEIIRLRGWFF